MDVCVAGMWHLGSVTAACLGELGINVIGLAEDKEEAEKLNEGIAPIYEPGLNELLCKGIHNGNLTFTNHMEDAVKKSKYIWVCYDTPVDENDHANEDFVVNKIRNICNCLSKEQGIIISSQLSVGTTAKIETFLTMLNNASRDLFIAYSPENLRLGKAINVFLNPDRIIVGTRTENAMKFFAPLFESITSTIIWMRPESAEMTKHAINGFLATSIVFINEIASICEMVGADASEVSKALLTEERIGPKAYLKPGNAFSGGTLARDIAYLLEKSREAGIIVPQIHGTKESNDSHKEWVYRTVSRLLGGIAYKKILILGLTYKEKTDTLRRSLTVELIHKLVRDGAVVKAYDPHITILPGEEGDGWMLTQNVLSEIKDSACVIITQKSTKYEEFGVLDEINNTNNILVIDENGFYRNNFKKNVQYYTIGKG